MMTKEEIEARVVHRSNHYSLTGVAEPGRNSVNDDGDSASESKPSSAKDEVNTRTCHPFTGITKPGPNDVLFGRGAGANNHAGNKKYRRMVEKRKEEYSASKRLDKSSVAMEIVDEWRALDPPGRFLGQNDKTKLWNDVGDEIAREKTKQALREGRPEKQSLQEEVEDQAARRSNHPSTGIAEPGPNDCLFGRGAGANNHPGNKKYRKMVEDRREKYAASELIAEKRLLAMEIVNEWRAMDPPGRFLRQDKETKLWKDVGDERAGEKAKQAPREKPPARQGVRRQNHREEFERASSKKQRQQLALSEAHQHQQGEMASEPPRLVHLPTSKQRMAGAPQQQIEHGSGQLARPSRQQTMARAQQIAMARFHLMTNLDIEAWSQTAQHIAVAERLKSLQQTIAVEGCENREVTGSEVEGCEKAAQEGGTSEARGAGKTKNFVEDRPGNEATSEGRIWC